MQLTLVVDGIPQAEETEDGPHNRRCRRVLAIEEPPLDTTGGGRRRGALGELAVEANEWGETCTLACGLSERVGRDTVSLPHSTMTDTDTDQDRWCSNLGGNKPAELTADERGLHAGWWWLRVNLSSPCARPTEQTRSPSENDPHVR